MIIVVDYCHKLCETSTHVCLHCLCAVREGKKKLLKTGCTGRVMRTHLSRQKFDP